MNQKAGLKGLGSSGLISIFERLIVPVVVSSPFDIPVVNAGSAEDGISAGAESVIIGSF